MYQDRGMAIDILLFPNPYLKSDILALPNPQLMTVSIVGVSTWSRCGARPFCLFLQPIPKYANDTVFNSHRTKEEICPRHDLDNVDHHAQLREILVFVQIDRPRHSETVGIIIFEASALTSITRG